MLPVGITDQPLFELCAETKSKTEYQVYLQRGVEARTAFMQVPPIKSAAAIINFMHLALSYGHIC